MLQLDDTTRSLLRKEQKVNRDKRVYVKVTVLLMLDQGFSIELVSTCLGIDDSTVYRYVQLYRSAASLSDYLDNHWVGYQGRLNEKQEQLLKEEVSTHLYTTAKEVCLWILHTFGFEYSHQGVAKLLHRLGFVFKKAKHVPGFADVEKQKEHLAQFEAFMAQKDENSVVYFNDGVHPMHNTRPEYGWILKGDEYPIPANSGRSRVNITGAINAEDVTDVIAVEDKMVNAQSVIKAWEAAEKRHPEKQIYHICDNAKYYHSKVLKEWLVKHPNTHVWFLPAYAPNLNLIERLWKFLRKQVINSEYYASFMEFKHAVMGFFSNISDHKSALESLLTLRFHLPKME